MEAIVDVEEEKEEEAGSLILQKKYFDRIRKQFLKFEWVSVTEGPKIQLIFIV